MLAVAAIEYRKKRKARKAEAAAAAAAAAAASEAAAEGEASPHPNEGSEGGSPAGYSSAQLIPHNGGGSPSSPHSGVLRARSGAQDYSLATEDEKTDRIRFPRTASDARSPPLSPNDSINPMDKHSHADRAMQHTTTTATTVSKSSRSARDRGDFRHGSHKKRLAHIPFIRHPVSGEDMEGAEGVWVKEEHEAVEWLSLFYVVAVLTVFSSAHELQSPEEIPIFLSYFLLLNWSWTSQTYYDVRYQCEDIYHRFCKACQIACFVYMGAASGRWNPSDMGDPSGLTGFDYETTVDANQSFNTVVLAFIGLRLILGIQYAVCMILAHRVKRPEKMGLLAQCFSMTGSTVFSIVAVSLPFTLPNTKIGFFYASIGAEMLMVWLNMPLGWHVKLDPAKIAERYAAFTLIILGEGFIGLTKSFNNAISGLSTSYPTIYAQVFLIIMVIFSLYLFLFSRFSPDETISESRVFVWQLVHFPLYFGLLLLQAGMVNVVTNIAFNQGIGLVYQQYNVTLNALGNNDNLNSTFLQNLGGNLNKLTLYPDWDTELSLLQSIAELPPAEQRQNVVMLSLQYFGQVIAQIGTSYGVDFPDGARDALNTLYGLNVTTTSNQTEMNERVNQAIALSLDVGGILGSDSLSGVLWLFPCAGMVLIFTCLRSISWYRYEGIAHWLVHGSQFVAGVVLALLGLLDIGPHTITVNIKGDAGLTNPMYNLVDAGWPLGIIGITYFTVYLGPLSILWILQALKGGNIFPSEETIMEEERRKREEGESPEQIRAEENFAPE